MKNKKLFLYLILLIAWNCKLLTISLSQNNIGINITGAAPNASAALDIDIPNTGLLIPRVALTATNTASPVTSPATSLIVYNTATTGTPPFNVVPGFYYWDGTQWVQMVTTNTSGGYTNFQVFNSSGTFTVPVGITRIMIEVWGGGGGGTVGVSGSYGGSGGAGGGYGKNIFTVIPGTIYTVTVGSGGTGSCTLSPNSGGTSSFGSLISATGGGGVGGTSSAPINITGGRGGYHYDSNQSGFGGSAGCGGIGGGGSSGNAGSAPGGGGSGGYAGGCGFSGASGRIIVWW